MIIKTVKIINNDSGKIVEKEVIKAVDQYDLSRIVTQMISWWKQQKTNYTGYKAEYEN